MRKYVLSALNVLSDAALVAIAVLAVPCAVMTAYEVPFPLFPLITAAILIGVCLSIWMHAGKFSYIAGILYGAVSIPLLIWKRTAILFGFRLFRFTMLDLIAADVPFLTVPEQVEPIEGLVISEEAAIGWFALFVMLFLGLSIAWSLIRSKMILLPLIVPLPIFMLGLIYTDLPLAHWTVFLLMVYLGACLVSGGMRVYETERYGLVTVIVLIALLLLGSLIFVFSPPDEYEPLTFEQRQEMMGDKLNELYNNLSGALSNRVKRTEDLTDEDEWKRTGEEILQVQSTKAGETYLRAYSLCAYRDNAWRNVPVYTGTWKSLHALGSRITATDSMSIHAEGSEMLYSPYGFVPEKSDYVQESYLAANGLTDYDWQFADTIPAPQTVSEEESRYIAWAKENYIIADRREKEALLAYLEREGLSDLGDNYKTAISIAQHIQSLAEYSTTPGKLPEGTDFVLYFLEESRIGYCVHFASATTALLQAMDIPARYVFGYRFFTAANEVKSVTDEMAHAWTEVYCPGIGWVRIESTAGANGFEEPDQTPSPSGTPEPEQTPEQTPEPSAEPSQDPYDPEQDGEQENPEPSENPEDGEQEEQEGGEQSEEGDKEMLALPTDEPDLPSLNLWWLLWLLLIPAGIFGLKGARKAVLERRQNTFRQKDAKAAILAMYRYQKRLEKYGAPRDPEELALAEEATFSNHAMTEERKVMHGIIRKSQQTLAKLPRWKRFVYRWFLFLD